MSRVCAVAVLLACAASGIGVGARQPGARQTGGGQTGGAGLGLGIIMGRVVDGSTERPVANVVVTLTAEGVRPAVAAGPGLPARASSASVVTDAEGRFLFHSLPGGRFSFAVKSPAAWFGGGYGARRPGGPAQLLELADAERATDVVLRVWKYASVSGTVLDHAGEPLIETRVAVVKLDFVAGRRRYGSRSEALTDDRGMYRIGHLLPGDYVACLPFTQVTLPLEAMAAIDNAGRGSGLVDQLYASGAPEIYGAGFRIGEFTLVRQSTAYGMNGPIGPMFSTPPPGADGRVPVYPFQFFPNAMRPADATMLTLEPGQDRGNTDFQTHLVPGVRVAGRVSSPDNAAAHLGIRLLPQSVNDTADERAMDIASTITDAMGAFTFLGVPAGAYVIKLASVPPAPRPPPPPPRADVMGPGGGVVSAVDVGGPPPPPGAPETPSLWATLGISVGDRDLTGLELTAQIGPRVSGRLAYDGSADHLTPDQVTKLTLTFDPVDGRTGPGAASFGRFDAGGQFKSAGIIPGRYLLHVGGNLAGWTLKSAVAGGHDVTDDALVVEGQDVTGVVITLTDRTSSLFGTVRDGQGAADRNADVIVFPADRARWTDSGASPRRERLVRTSPRGAYAFENLPAGDYLVVAIDDRLAANWSDPARLEKFAAAATRVTMAAADQRPQDLVTAVIR